MIKQLMKQLFGTQAKPPRHKGPMAVYIDRHRHNHVPLYLRKGGPISPGMKREINRPDFQRGASLAEDFTQVCDVRSSID